MRGLRAREQRALGLLEPDEGTVSLFGQPPSQAIEAGAIGAMLQTGSLIHDLTICRKST